MAKKRVTIKLKHPNPLFEEWLVEWRDKAIEKDSKLQYCYGKALQSLQHYPLPLETGRDCRILQGFGEKLCQMIDEKLLEYKRKNIPTTSSLNQTDEQASSVKPSMSTLRSSKSLTPKKYVPAWRSGSWAILITLYTKSLEPLYPGFMLKLDIIKYAKNLCDASFVKPNPGSYYTAWSTMKQLLEKKLVIKSSSPAKYTLTAEGILLAQKLHENNFNGEYISPKKNDMDDINSVQSVETMLPDISKTLESPTKKRKKKRSASTQSSSSLAPASLAHFESETASTCSNLSQEETFICAPDTFDIILVVDKQEVAGGTRHLIDDTALVELTNLKVAYEVKNLKVGDYMWICRDRCTKKELVLPYIVERKRMDDFGGSIKDGRFHEQKFRLKQCGIQNLVYLIESYGNNTYTGLPIGTLFQAAINTLIQDGFSIKFTDNTRATMKYFANFTHILKGLYEGKTLVSCPKQNLSEALSDEDLVSLMTFQEFNKGASKNRNFKVREMFVRQLLHLKGVSVDKALSIVEKYPTPQLLKTAYSQNISPINEKLLANLQYGKLKKKIGPTISQTIHQWFTNQTY